MKISPLFLEPQGIRKRTSFFAHQKYFTFETTERRQEQKCPSEILKNFIYPKTEYAYCHLSGEIIFLTITDCNLDT